MPMTGVATHCHPPSSHLCSLPSPPGEQREGKATRRAHEFSLTFQDMFGCLHTAEGWGGEDGGDLNAAVQ